MHTHKLIFAKYVYNILCIHGWTYLEMSESGMSSQSNKHILGMLRKCQIVTVSARLKWHQPLIPPLGRQRQAEFKASMIQNSQSYMVRPCIEK